MALEHSFQHPEVYLYTFVFSAMGYGSVVFVLLLIKTSGSTNAEIVKSCRKVFTIGETMYMHDCETERVCVRDRERQRESGRVSAGEPLQK